MPDQWFLRTPLGDYQLNNTFTAPHYDPGGVDTGAALRRDGRRSYQRSGDGLRTPGPLVLRGRVWRDDHDVAAIVDELNAIREAVAGTTEVLRITPAGTYTYEQLAGGPPPELTPDGLGGWEVTIELWPGRAHPTFVPVPDLDIVPDGIWLESLFIQQEDGTPVGTWFDASSAEYHMNSVDAGYPTFRVNRTQSGAPAVTNDGSAARLKGQTRWLTNGTEPFTFFLVAASTHDSFSEPLSNMATFSGPVPGGFSFWWPQNAANSYRVRFDNGNAVQTQFGPNLNDGDFHIFCLTRDDTNGLRAFVDGALAAQHALFGLTAANQPLCIFGPCADDGVHSRYYNGDIAALLWFRRSLSDVERATVTSYLAQRYTTP